MRVLKVVAMHEKIHIGCRAGNAECGEREAPDDPVANVLLLEPSQNLFDDVLKIHGHIMIRERLVIGKQPML